MGLPGALILPLEHEFGWSATDLQRAGDAHPAVRADGAVRGGVDRALRPEARHPGGHAHHRRCCCCSRWHDEPLASAVLFGVVVGVGTGMTALVMSAIVSTRWFTARRGLVHRHAHREQRDRPARVPAARGVAREPLRLALRARAVADRPRRRGGRGLAVHGRPPRRPRPRPLWRDRRPVARRPLGRRFRHAFRVLREVAPMPAFWVLAGTFFVCGLSHQWPGPDPFHLALRRLRRALGHRRLDAGADRASATSSAPIGSGWLSDRYDNRALLFVYYGLRGLSLLYLPSSCFSIYGAVARSRCFMASTGSRPCRRRRGSAREMFRARARRRRVRLDFRLPHDRRRLRRLPRRFFAHASGRPICRRSISAACACLIAALAVWLIDRRPAPARRRCASKPG